MCSVFGISRQGYYKQLVRKVKVSTDRKQIISMVLEQRKIMPRLGTPKLYHLLKPEWNAMGIKCGRDKLCSILREERMLVKKKKNFTKTTNSMHRFRKYPNLIENMTIDQPEQVWVSDITYVRVKDGFLYLSLITDAFSKQIMGYNLSDNMKVESSIKALKRAVANRMYPNRTLIHHSDRGLQYCAPAYTEILEENRIAISMTSKYDPYENAIAERVNGILKSEFDVGEVFINKQEARKVINESIQIYNVLRPHLTCHYRTPKQAHEHPNFTPIKWANRFSKHKISTVKNNFVSLKQIN